MCTKRISSTTIKAELKPHSDGRRQLRYRIDPTSRYTHLPSGYDWDGSEKRKEVEAAEREAVRLVLLMPRCTHAYICTHADIQMYPCLHMHPRMHAHR